MICRFAIQFIHECQIIRIELLRILFLRTIRTTTTTKTSSSSTSTTTIHNTIAIDYPIGRCLLTVPSGVRGITTNCTFHLQPPSLIQPRTAEPLGALKGSMALLGTNRAILIFLQRPIQQGQFPQLRLLVHILIIVNDHEHILNHLGGGIDRRLVLTGDDDVEGLMIALHDLPIPPPPRPLLHRPLAANGNLAPRLILHFLLRLPPRPDDQPYEIVRRVLLDGNVDLTRSLPRKQRRGDGLREVIAAGGAGGELEDGLEGVLPQEGVSLPPPDGAGVFALAVRTVDGRRGGRAGGMADGEGVDGGSGCVEVGQLGVAFPQRLLEGCELGGLGGGEGGGQAGQEIEDGVVAVVGAAVIGGVGGCGVGCGIAAACPS